MTFEVYGSGHVLWPNVVLAFIFIVGNLVWRDRVWGKLASRYADLDSDEVYEEKRRIGVRIGYLYFQSITLRTSKSGLEFIPQGMVNKYLYKPVYIPWSETHNVLRRKGFISPGFLAFDVGNPTVANLAIAEFVLAGTPLRAD
jgi:hypothetical protein